MTNFTATLTFGDTEKVMNLNDDTLHTIYPAAIQLAAKNGVEITEDDLDNDEYECPMDGMWSYKGLTIEVNEED